MEVAGLALGVASAVGMLGQIFDGCVKAYSFFTSASNLGRDSDRVICKIRIEEMRLMVWGREWGVAEGKLEAHLAAANGGENDALKKLAEMILKQLLDTIGNTQKLRQRYGVKEDGGAGTEKAQSPGVGADLRLRARWVIADKDKFDMLLKDLKDYNDGLERLFPPSRVATLQRTWTNELLQGAKRDITQLHLLESASMGTYPQLNNCASLKQLRINLDAEESSKFKPTSALKIPESKLKFPHEDDLERVQGWYEDKPVIIEWASYCDATDLDSRLLIYQRVDSLARMVHSASNRHPDLHTLDCLGYVDDSSRKRYGLTYLDPRSSVPSSKGLAVEYPSPTTLSSVIEDPQLRAPDLNLRFQLAHTLAVALWSFHSLDWLHKSISSDNIMFFTTNDPSAPSATTPSLSHPYLAGFTTSRPSDLVEMTAPPPASTSRPACDLYRHPSSLGIWRQSYRHHFDIYSLGLVLLEIGLWKSLRKDFWKPKYTSTTFRDKAVLPVLVPGLGSKTGSRYRTVVERCLRYGDERERSAGDPPVKDEGMKQERMMEWVVSVLEGLRV
ncbi:MAG: Ribosome biogenesis protein erb1 [Chaenotheca gracillima]|nr:MAG: Ribosome biogenesis protein erb1 [Chaenotheca gracillima]